MSKTKINKALDFNKLLEEQSKGKLLKKHISFPCYAPIKYDGNYVVVEVYHDTVTFHTSGGLTYTHEDRAGDIFMGVTNGFYLAERIWGAGKLGDRNNCNLHGPKPNQKSFGHSYKVFNFLTSTEYATGRGIHKFNKSLKALQTSGIPLRNIVEYPIVHNKKEFENLLMKRGREGWEGIMGIAIDYIWQNTTSRKINFVKYKRRPTVDLLCIGTKDGGGKYEGMIGSLLMQDSQGRTVNVGSGMSDVDRLKDPSYFIDEVCEIEYEQIVHTYVQATHPPLNEGVLIRDKDTEDID